MQEFLELRQRIKDRLAEFKAERLNESHGHFLAYEFSDIHLTTAQREFSYLADQLRLFASGRLVRRALHLMRFDLEKAEEALAALVHAIGVERAQRLRERSAQVVIHSKRAKG